MEVEKSNCNFTATEEQWLDVLKGNKSYNNVTFFNNYYNENEIALSIFKYRNVLLNKQNKIKNIDKVDNLYKSIINKDYQSIKKEFEEMFLEVFDDDDINIIIKMIDSKEKLMNLIQLHNKKLNRLMYLITIL